MLHERRDKIIEKIKLDRTIKVNDLVKEYSVSIETIRRDLEFLEKEGYLKRVYGGAVLSDLYVKEPDYHYRKIINEAEKEAIGKKALDLVNDSDILFMDTGSTVLELARTMKIKKDLTVITNSTVIAHELIGYNNCKVILLGGVLREGELTVSGFICDNNLNNFNANKAIIGVGGITANGITDYNTEESNTRRLMIKRANKVIALADSSKFGVVAMNHICDIKNIDILITDSGTPKSAIYEIESLGVRVLVANKTSID